MDAGKAFEFDICGRPVFGKAGGMSIALLPKTEHSRLDQRRPTTRIAHPLTHGNLPRQSGRHAADRSPGWPLAARLKAGQHLRQTGTPLMPARFSSPTPRPHPFPDPNIPAGGFRPQRAGKQRPDQATNSPAKARSIRAMLSLTP